MIVRPPASSAGSGGQSASGDGGGGVTTGGLESLGGGAATAGVGGSQGPTPLQSALTEVVRSAGCGAPYPTTQSGVKQTIETMGTKDPNCAAHLLNGQPVCGPWAVPRDYYVYLPAGYDENQAYPLIFEAPGCGGNGSTIYGFPELRSEAIRIGLSPGPNSVGHGTNPEQGCFDDKEGNDSIDWVFYEQLYDKLNGELCFDRNRVFAAGQSSGAWLTNELGCKYAGDPQRPVRGVIVYQGGLPTDPSYAPTCSDRPLAGVWLHEVNSVTAPFSNQLVAINRAMSLAHCSAPSYADSTYTSFPIGEGKPDDTCHRINDCDPLYPLIVCPFPNQAQSSREDVVDPAGSIFVRSFSRLPLGSPPQ